MFAPVYALAIASVMTNGLMPVFTVRKPLTNPISEPAARPTTMTMGSGTAYDSISPAMLTAAGAMDPRPPPLPAPLDGDGARPVEHDGDEEDEAGQQLDPESGHAQEGQSGLDRAQPQAA